MSPQAPVSMANSIGRPLGLECHYEYDRIKGKFLYRFYRHRRYIGSVSDPARVVARMERYANSK